MPQSGASVATQTSAPEGERLWHWLKESLHFVRLRPQPIAEVEVSRFEGKRGDSYMLRSPRGQYLKLDPQNYFLWSQMDGRRTVTDLLMAYFRTYKSFANARLKTLLTTLHAKGFLIEPPVNVYANLYAKLQGEGVSGLGSRVMHSFMQHEFSINNLDGIISRLYNGGVKWFFSRPALLLYVAIILIGAVLFIQQILGSTYSLLQTGNSFGLGFVLVILASLFTIFLHECGHAFATKHFGRTVNRGGFMIYLGMPAFFVNTMDIWMAGKKARIAVSWAGPFVNLIVGSICGIIITVWPLFTLNDILFKVGVMAYIGAIVNLNPLIELDGYFILMDWLEIPSLRKRALAFVRGKMWEKLRKREAFDADERIFTIFGALATLYTAYIVVLSVFLWKDRLVSMIASLWEAPGWLPKVILGFVVVALVVPLVVSLALKLYTAIKRGLMWLLARGVFANKRNLSLILLAAIAILSGVPWAVHMQGQAGNRADIAFFLAHLLLIVTGLGVLALTVANPNRSQMQRSFQAAAPALLLLLAAEAAAFLTPPIAPWLYWAGTIALLPIALLSFNANDLRLATGHERAVLVITLLVGTVASLVLTADTATKGAGIGRSVAAGLAIFAGMTTASLLLPTFGAFLRTSFGHAWSFVIVGILGLAGGSALTGYALLTAIPSWLPPLAWDLGLGFLVAGLILYYLTQAGLQLPLPVQREETVIFDDQERLRSAVRQVGKFLLGQYQGLFGDRRARELTEQINTLALSAQWGVTVRRSEVAIDRRLEEAGILRQAQMMQEFLDHLIVSLNGLAGVGFTKSALQRVYDSLPWEQREILGEYVLRGTAWGGALSRRFEEAHQDHRALLHSIPLFVHCDDDEIEALITQMEERHYRQDEAIITQGEMGEEFFIVKRGLVVVWQKDDSGYEQRVNEHRRGGFFGEVALLKNTPRNATCLAGTLVDVLVLKRKDFDALIRRYFDLGVKLDHAIQYTQILRNLPFFAETPMAKIKEISAHLTEMRLAAGQTLFRQGDEGDRFYIIMEGELTVWLEQNSAKQLIARRGPGEYVGEIALLHNVPRTAAVKAATDCLLLTLQRDDFLTLMQQEELHRGMERVSSRRLLDLERQNRRPEFVAL